MKLRFLGTRGEIERRTRRHRMHSSLLVGYRRAEIVVDWGADWRARMGSLSPRAIFVTHAHPDHVGGLRDGAPCPVYATEEAWRAIGRYAIPTPRVVPPRNAVDVGGLTFEAFPVEHSLRAPAVAYRISAGRVRVLYAPDVVAIEDQAEALSGLDVYIGDGAAVTRPIVRRRNGGLVGHASIRSQLAWCGAARVPQAVFTHCGSEIVGGDGRTLAAKVRALGREQGVRAEIAHDGMQILVR